MSVRNIRKPSLIQAFIPVVILIFLLSVNVIYLFLDDGMSGSNQLILLFAAAIATVISMRLGHTWDELQDGVVSSIKNVIPSFIILFMIGALSGSWLVSGIIPAMVYYGLDLVNPAFFLVAACIVSSIVSLATGSSWTTVATIGVALLGIGKVLGMSEGMVAGAIISGAYFGDKLSPMSETTNLAPAMAGTDLFTHIKYMSKTTIPSIIITLIIFLVLGLVNHGDSQAIDIASIQTAITDKFDIHLGLFIVPAFLLFLIIKKVPAVPALFIGVTLGGIMAVVFQSDVLKEVVGGTGANNFITLSKGVMQSMFSSVELKSDNALVAALLSSSGMQGMMGTIWLIMCAMVFGGIMEAGGLLHRISEEVIKMITSSGSLITSTVASCIFFNITASDQYLAIVVPGKMFSEAYRERGLRPEVLSRSLEDAGTVTSVLVPWNTCGAYMASKLQVGTFMYLPYCFFNIISPLMSILYAYLFVKPDPELVNKAMENLKARVSENDTVEGTDYVAKSQVG